MRPQDVAILLKICALENVEWQLVPLSASIKISIGEISESLNRSRLAGLVDYNKKKVDCLNFMEFLEHGFQYVFPVEPGAYVRGIPTAHTHPLIRQKFISEMDYVWPDSKGSTMGLVVEPLYPRQTEAALEDARYYKLLALTDMIRIGRAREVKFAIAELKKELL